MIETRGDESGERRSLWAVVLAGENRGTAAGILLAAQWIEARDRSATLVCFPSDHLVMEAAAFMEHVADLASFVEREPRRIVLLGAPPSQPETECGWIEPGEPVGWTSQGPVHAIQRFREKPSVSGEAFEGGGGSTLGPGESLEHFRVRRARRSAALGRA